MSLNYGLLIGPAIGCVLSVMTIRAAASVVIKGQKKLDFTNEDLECELLQVRNTRDAAQYLAICFWFLMGAYMIFLNPVVHDDPQEIVGTNVIAQETAEPVDTTETIRITTEKSIDDVNEKSKQGYEKFLKEEE